MAIEKVYPQLRCSVCGGELESVEPETKYVFVLSVKPCKRCAAQQKREPDRLAVGGRKHPVRAIKQIRELLVKHGGR